MLASTNFAVYIDMSPLFSYLAATAWALQLGLCCTILLILLHSSSGVLWQSNVAHSGLSSLTTTSLSLLAAVVGEIVGGVGGWEGGASALTLSAQVATLGLSCVAV